MSRRLVAMLDIPVWGRTLIGWTYTELPVGGRAAP
jgi:hypothetical protein